MNQAVQIILYLGAIQGMLLSIFLFSIQTNRISNRLLGLLTLFWGIIIASFGLQAEGMYTRFPHLLAVFSPLLLTLFPLLYLQVKYLVSRHNRFQYSDLWHFAPLLVMTLLNIAFYIKTGEEKLAILHTEPLYFKIIRILQGEVVALQGVVYSILALKLLSTYKSKIRDYLSNVDKMMLKIQTTGISLSLFAWIIGIVGIHLDYFDIEINVDLFVFVYLTLVLVIYIISYAALKSPEIFKLDASQIKVKFLRSQQSSENVYEKTINKAAASIIKETTLIIEDSQIHDVNDKLIGYIEEEKPYLNAELSLQDLADQLDVKRHTLSSAINQIHNKNFYEFINHYRVEEVKSMLTDPKNKHLKLISLAYDAGFNSKATFNRIFKQMTSMTPSQYVLKQEAD